MSRRTREELIDDSDQTSLADETVTFGLDGVDYEIDLSHDNAARFRESMAPWIGDGRRVPRTPRHGASASTVRTWARNQGIDVGRRGRVPAAVYIRFNEHRREKRRSSSVR